MGTIDLYYYLFDIKAGKTETTEELTLDFRFEGSNFQETSTTDTTTSEP